MHYVRFLKPPKVQGNGAGRRLTALCTISTDLGDDFLPADADLEVALSANDIKSGLVASQKIRWKSGMRVLPLEMRVSQRTAGLCFLDVSPLDSLLARATYSGGSDAQLRMPLVVPARSVMVVIPQEESLADRMNVRRLDLGRHGTLKVWEESGESIARHIW